MTGGPFQSTRLKSPGWLGLRARNFRNLKFCLYDTRKPRVLNCKSVGRLLHEKLNFQTNLFRIYLSQDQRSNKRPADILCVKNDKRIPEIDMKDMCMVGKYIYVLENFFHMVNEGARVKDKKIQCLEITFHFVSSLLSPGRHSFL